MRSSNGLFSNRAFSLGFLLFYCMFSSLLVTSLCDKLRSLITTDLYKYNNKMHPVTNKCILRYYISLCTSDDIQVMHGSRGNWNILALREGRYVVKSKEHQGTSNLHYFFSGMKLTHVVFICITFQTY